ncbi:hypothetical protein IW143_003788, partial [Coemansia sp. RSA 520]
TRRYEPAYSSKQVGGQSMATARQLAMDRHKLGGKHRAPRNVVHTKTQTIYHEQ